jgi:OmpA family/PEGA domain
MRTDMSPGSRWTGGLVRVCGCAAVALMMVAAPAIARSGMDTGRIKIHVDPKQAYVFVDGNAIRDGSQTLVLNAGKHTIGVYNYGYTPDVQTVDVTAGQTTDMDVMLHARGQLVTGPFGDIEFKGYPRAAVFLNGTTPAYFVGHVDEFDNNWLWHQWLLVKPGTYQAMVTQDGRTIWSGPVKVNAGERVVVDLNNGGQMSTKDFQRGFTLGPQPRFDAGLASAMVPIAPVTVQFAAVNPQTACGQSADLKWKVSGAVDTSITHIGKVPDVGDRKVEPTKATSYELVAKGPGGEATERAQVAVTVPTATLALSQPEVRYHKIGDDVVRQDAATLSWSTSNAKSVTIDPLGSVPASGHRIVEATPGTSTDGPIDRNMVYTINAVNACGETTTRTAELHVVGSVDPAPSVTLASVFYPTAYPEPSHPRVGLVASEERMLADTAAAFQKNEQYDPKDKLVIVGHADVRGPARYNLALSRRRAEAVRAYLISQGIPADRIEIRADGKRKELTVAEVQQLQAQDTQNPPKWMATQKYATWLAYNRRVDIVLEPTGQKSVEAYPNAATSARLLWERPVPPERAVAAASRMARANGGPLAIR